MKDSWLTFNPDVCIWIELGCCSHRSLSSFVVILAINFVAIFVDERRVSTYDISLKTCMLDFLYATSAHVRVFSKT
jgi:hypothetical protein